MGPTLLLDKSALQAFSGRALSAAYRHYHLVVPPVLLSEILANYTKKSKRDNLFELLVRKFKGANFSLNVDSSILCRDELRGSFSVPLDGRPVVKGVRLDIQKLVTVAEETEHHKAVRRWLDGLVSEIEKTRSLNWNQKKNSADLEGFRNEFRTRFERRGLPLPKITALADVPLRVDQMLQKYDQSKLLADLCSLNGLTQVEAQLVAERFTKHHPKLVASFAPYSYFCCRTRLIFYTSLANGLIGTRPSNIIDLDYLLYLPFCKVFSSGDELHELLAPLLLGKDRVFVKSAELKRDLEAIQFFWNSLTNPQRNMWLERFGRWPPTSIHSFSFQVYRRFWLPREICGNMAKRLSPEFKKKIESELRHATAEYKKKKEDSSAQPISIVHHTPGIMPGVEGIVIEYADPEKEVP